MAIEDIQLDKVEPHVGEVFVADFGEQGTVDLVLIEAAARPTGNANDSAFSLVFRGPLDRVFEQGSIDLSHASIGREHIFLVAVGESEAGRLYEAVFTRFRR